MIKTKLKTTILTILILCLSIAPCGTLLTMAAQPGSVAPLYNNTSSTTLIVELLFTIILLKINENKNILRITKGG